jgi:DNA-binding response OmpR family regulator
MITKNSLIFILEDDKAYGILIQNHLKKAGYQKAVLFQDENLCLNNMTKRPKILISDYHLNYMSGLQIIKKAKESNNGLYTILLSGAYHKEKFSNDIPLSEINKYIRKGECEFKELVKTLDNLTEQYYDENFYS